MARLDDGRPGDGLWRLHRGDRPIRHAGTPAILSQGAVAQPRFRPLGGSRQRPCSCRWGPLPIEQQEPPLAVRPERDWTNPPLSRGTRGAFHAELVCLAVAQVLLGFNCEHRWIRFAYCRLGHLFRYLPNQPGYHMRLRAAAPLLAQAISHLARVSPSWCDSLRLIDATPLPCGALRETVNRSDIGGTGGDGFCASHTRYYWGLKLYLVTAPDGMPVTWCLADPKLPRAGGLPGPVSYTHLRAHE